MDHLLDSDIEKILQKPPQYTRLKRHLRTLLHHSTPRKIANLVRVELCRKRRRTTVNGYPYIIIIDTGNICNLRCPLCPTGCRRPVRRSFMPYDRFTRLVDLFAPWAYEVTLHNWGEPFLNQDILRMIAYCRKNNVGTNLSSNLNHMPFSAEELVKSGLEYLIVSLDGTTQDVYETYRATGKLDIVFKNLKEIIAAKRRLGSPTPVIEWQFLVMRHNCRQAAEARALAQEIGVDLIRFIPVGLPFDTENQSALMRQWYPSATDDNGRYINERFLQKPIPGGCFYLYRSVTITPNGFVAPCCAVWKDSDIFGNSETEDFQSLWNNRHYQAARALFGAGGAKDASAPSCCRRCTIFKK